MVDSATCWLFWIFLLSAPFSLAKEVYCPSDTDHVQWKARCQVCLHVTSQALCDAVGVWVQCDKEACETTVYKDAQDGTIHSYSRGCVSVSHCSIDTHQPHCQVVRNVESAKSDGVERMEQEPFHRGQGQVKDMLKCKWCSPGDCVPLVPDLCPPEGALHCFTCTAHDIQGCWVSGYYQLCEPRDTCSQVSTTNEKGLVVLRMGCVPLESCPPQALGPHLWQCHPNPHGGQHCLNCHVWHHDPVYPEKPRHVCQEPDTARCSLSAGAHLHTFDGEDMLKLPGSCIYILSQDKSADSAGLQFHSFRVSINLDSVSTSRFVDMWAVKEVKIFFSGGQTVYLGQDEDGVLFNSQPIGALSVYTDGIDAVLSQDFKVTFKDGVIRITILSNGVQVEWDFNRQVSVTAPAALSTWLSGLCGDYNHKKQDDLRLGPSINKPVMCSVQALPEEATQGAVISKRYVSGWVRSWMLRRDEEEAACVAHCQEAVNNL